MTTAGKLVRLGFRDGQAALAGIGRLGDAGTPLPHPPGGQRRPRRRPRRAAAAGRRGRGPGGDAGRGRRRRGHRDAAVRRARAPAPPCPRTSPATPSTGASSPTRRSARPAPRRTPCARRCCVPSAPTRTTRHRSPALPDAQAVDALRVEYRRILLRLAARDLAHHLSRRRRRGRDRRPRGRHAGGRPGRGPRAGRGERRHRPARRGRDGQVRRPRAQLRLRRGRDLRLRAGSPGPTSPQALRAATQLASHLMQVCSDHTSEGTIWPVDANLRPEGSSGPLVRTLASHRGYYEKWAKTWEFQALLKARPVAGDLALGREYVEMIAPMVWTAAERDGFVADVQAMRRRVVDHIPAHEAERQLKLGSGGLRDVEFAVQLLQLVHGRADPSLRSGATLSALARADRRRLRRPRGRRGAARGLRLPAHPRAPHPAVPAAAYARRARRRGVAAPARPLAGALLRAGRAARQAVALPPPRGAPPAREALLPPAARRRRQAARRGRPAVAGRRPGAAGRARLPRPAGRAAAPRGAHQRGLAHLRHPAHAAAGHARVVRRRPRPRRRASSASAGSARASAPRRGTSRCCATRGRSPSGSPCVLGTSRYATDLLEREPQGVRMLGESLAPLSAEALTTEMLAIAGRHDEPEAAARAVRAVRRRELFRIACGELFEEIDVAEVGKGAVAADRRDPGGHPRRGHGGGPRAAVAGRGCRPGWRSSRWAATAASSCPTAATPT